MEVYPTQISLLKEYLNTPLPGARAHQLMAVTGRSTKLEPLDDTRQAAVMIHLYSHRGEFHTVYIKRAGHEKDKHRGQIGFPGGKVEDDDLSLMHTAIRETREEIGLAIEDDQVIGALSPLFIPVSNFIVHPYISFGTKPIHYSLQIEEVDQVIETSLGHLTRQTFDQRKDLTFSSQMTLRNVPYLDLHGEILWGATAMITAELLSVWPDDR